MQNKAVSKVTIIEALNEGEEVTAREAMRKIARSGHHCLLYTSPSPRD